MKKIKSFENFLESKYELVGDNIDEVLDAVNVLKFYYGEDYVTVQDDSGHESGNKVSVYITFSPNIKLWSGGEIPSSNIIREMNYILEEEMKKPRLYKIDSY